jgi:hypothetical protein
MVSLHLSPESSDFVPVVKEACAGQSAGHARAREPSTWLRILAGGSVHGLVIFSGRMISSNSFSLR